MRSARNAFTIVELLVVIGVIATLAALLLPAVASARALARRTKCESNLHAVSVAVRLYLNQSNEFMPAAAQMPSLHLNSDPRIADVLAPYLPDRAILKCPDDTARNYFASEGSSYEYASSLGGRRVSDSFLTRRFGEANTPVMYDYEPFHGRPGDKGAMNFLFADGHVGDLE